MQTRPAGEQGRQSGRARVQGLADLRGAREGVGSLGKVQSTRNMISRDRVHCEGQGGSKTPGTNPIFLAQGDSGHQSQRRKGVTQVVTLSVL